TPEGEVLLDRPGAHRGARLAVEIAPPGLRLARPEGPGQVRFAVVLPMRGDDACLAAGVGDTERAHRGDGELAAAKRDPARKPCDVATVHAHRHVAGEPLARVTPDVLGLHQRVE